MRRPVSTVLWILFTLFIVYGTTMPFNFSHEPGWAARKLSHVPLNPFVAPDTGRRVSIPDVVQNVLLFLPFGVLGALRLRSPTRSRPAVVAVVVLLGSVLAASIETLQLFTVDRVSAVSDVLADTVGATAGVVLALIAERASVRGLRRLARGGLLRQPACYAALVAALVVVVAAWEPFDATLDVGSVVPKLRALAHDPWQAGALTDEGVATMQYILFAWAGAALLTEARVRRAAGIVAGVGAAAAFGLEASQLVIASRMPSLEDATVRAAAVILGLLAWRAARRWPRPGAWYAALLLGTAAGAAMQMLTPFEVAPAYRAFNWFPFLGYYQHTTFDTVSHVIEILLLYFPVGFCACLVMRRRATAALASLVATAAIAFPIEYAQGWFVGRYPDVTDAALSLVGAAFGVLAGSYGASLFGQRAALIGQSTLDSSR